MADTFENLKVFQEAHSLVLKIYKISYNSPHHENFALTSQLRRAVSSIAANIVEGNTRNHKKEFIQFLYLSKGSLEETKYHLLLARDLEYLSDKDYNDLHKQTENVGRLLSGLIKYCKAEVKLIS